MVMFCVIRAEEEEKARREADRKARIQRDTRRTDEPVIEVAAQLTEHRDSPGVGNWRKVKSNNVSFKRRQQITSFH